MVTNENVVYYGVIIYYRNMIIKTHTMLLRKFIAIFLFIAKSQNKGKNSPIRDIGQLS